MTPRVCAANFIFSMVEESTAEPFVSMVSASTALFIAAVSAFPSTTMISFNFITSLQLTLFPHTRYSYHTRKPDGFHSIHRFHTKNVTFPFAQTSKNTKRLVENPPGVDYRNHFNLIS